ncbi:CaiB/BaiF CoA transferase family protein [Gilvimarinus sp. F26214L]|uniref:CaiB/BaiF CoA transferase family protein n=1 Tax=Gilvimarinus sp. DZF01 TaxID=3461371 RepID=UPI0040468191
MGPLNGIRVIEIAGLGPAPFCAMLLADLGAEVIRVDRLDQTGKRSQNGLVDRGRRSIALNLKSSAGRETVLRLLEGADVVLEGFRPGVMERLGLGPDACLQRNGKLVYGRMTGWGQEGPLAQSAGHDINYIAVTGALHSMGAADRPPSPPLNLVGDYGGGGMLLGLGVLAALLERNSSGKGQVVDAAMVDGSALLMTVFYGMHANGMWNDTRESNLLDGAAHFYRSYECSDGKFIAVGALEPQFYRELLEKCGLSDEAFATQDPASWPDLSERFARLFRTRSRDEWCQLLEGDTCVAPVLDLGEAPHHPHNRARETFVKHDGILQPAPAPRFSRSKAQLERPAPTIGEHSENVLKSFGFEDTEIANLIAAGEIAGGK